MTVMPNGGVQTGGGGTASFQDTAALYAAGVLALGAGGSLLARRKFARKN